MRGGFTFCDVDVADLNLEYAPEKENTFVYSPAETSSHYEAFDGHSGGYYYGSWTEPKEFTLRCFFEEKHINKGIMSKIYNLFKTGRTGKLVFQKRPWCYYIATVNAVPSLDMTNYLNGLITIRMTATYPFARSDIIYRNRNERYRDNMLANTAVFESNEMVPQTFFENQTEAFSLLLGNPGTELAPVGIYVYGNSPGGLRITNHTTGQVMCLTEFTDEVTTNIDKRIYIDGLNGKTLLKPMPDTEGSSELALIFHESGFISLEPGYPAHRNMFVSYDHSDIISNRAYFPTGITGKYIFLNGNWYKIKEQSDDRHTITLYDTVDAKGSQKTQIMTLNEIDVEPVNQTISTDFSIEFVFKPTYA